jgi:uncharacterized protein affecting Mg2+/Co2+ transport
MISEDHPRMYRAVTRHIEVTVEPNFLPERSSAENRQYFWSYTIVITNSGNETVQLRTRHWIITDATGRKQEVRGEGVVGEQPILAPGERFAASDRVGFHDRALSDGERERREVRNRRANIFARQPRQQARVELTAPSSLFCFTLELQRPCKALGNGPGS